MSIRTTKLARYAVMPGFLPRLRELLGTGFSFLASVIAVLYYNIGLLPKGHPYLDASNYGKFGIRHAVSEAGRNLVYSKKHIDQVVLYYVILVGLVILALQFVLLFTSLITMPVLASNWFDSYTVSWTNFFTSSTISPSQDIAFVVLDKVFGAVRNLGGSTTSFFGSCVGTAVTCTDIRGNNIFTPAVFPTPFHIALHQMLAFYSLGIAFVAGLIIMYTIVAIVGETVTSGTPFGQRFNRAWFIPRLIVFFALIAPMNLGLGGANNDGINMAQIITLSVAKFGSNMATNAWLGFVDQSTLSGVSASSLLGKGDLMLSLPNVPELATLTQFMYIVRMCMYAEKIINGIDVYPYVVRPHSDDTTPVNLIGGGSAPYNSMGGTTNNYLPYYDSSALPIDFSLAVEFSRYNDVILRFGHRNPPGGLATNLNDPPGEYDELGNVEPTCGEMKFEVSSLDPFVIGPAPAGDPGMSVQQVYWLNIDQFLFASEMLTEIPYCMMQATLPYDQDTTCLNNPISGTPNTPNLAATLPTISGAGINFPFTNNTRWLNIENARAALEITNAINKAALNGQLLTWSGASPVSYIGGSVDAAFLSYYDDPSYINSLIMPNEIRERGWAGAALWYNKLAEINGIYGAAVQNIPRPYKYPKVMEQIAAQHNIVDKNPSYAERFNPRLGSGKLADLPRPGDQYIAAALYGAFEFWNISSAQETPFIKSSNNAIVNAINMVFGTNGVFDIVENKGVYPLAMLSGLGKGMVDAAVRNLFVGVVGQGAGQFIDDAGSKALATTVSGFMFRIGMMGMSIGFILYYVLPIMPFIYFFFAFSGWIKGIFEAVLAMPLWALAHIKIDGEGLPGPWATNGYFLLFEIFLRPILIIFAFVFSISIFAALVDTLHNSYQLLVYAASGSDIEAEINRYTAPLGNYGATPATLTASGIGVISNLSSFNLDNTTALLRGPIDELFFTILYVIIVYMIGLSTFKLVDAIPNNIMRWMGVTVSTFHETAGDPAAELSGKMYRGVNMTNAQIRSMMDRSGKTLVDEAIINK